MICCEKCFIDTEIKAVIKSLNCKGNCEICQNKGVFIYDISKNDILTIMFNELLEIYSKKNDLPGFPKEKLTMLKDDLYDRWNIFSIDKEKIYHLIKEICKDKYNDEPSIFDDSVGIRELYDQKYIYENSVLRNHSWSDFVNAIKQNNRFHTDHINLEVFKQYCEAAAFSFKSNTILHRARIWNGDVPWDKKQMGAPPGGRASGGRINPVGISYLYLCSDSETAIREIRAGIHECISVATFKLNATLKSQLKIVDLSLFTQISPFIASTENPDFYTSYAIDIKHLHEIHDSIAEPMGKQDRQLEYLPTQYLCDFIKSCGYDGVKYSSTMDSNHYNLAVFDVNLFKCKSIKQYKIEKLNYVLQNY